MSARRPITALTLLGLSAVLSGCSDESFAGSLGGSLIGDEASPSPSVAFDSNVRRNARDVPVDRIVQVRADGGQLTKVELTSTEGAVDGQIGPDGTWVAAERLEPGTSYTLTSVATGDDGPQRDRRAFTTSDLTLDEQTFATIAPLDGETVGVGMPVIISFDVPVTDRATFEKHLKVTSTPSQEGSWHWLSDSEVHWRPARYWQAGTDVSVDVDINSLPAGGGVYGQEDRHIDFHVGDANVYKVDARTHDMKVYSNGALLRTIPITTGKEGFTTRSGVKVIIEKFREKRMNSETVGIPAGSAEAYDIDDVEYAMRLTYSGEFIHAAPWSVGSQGSANVSHGCTGMSTANAGWLYALSKRGDVVEYVGTDRPMTFDNGYGDWNVSFAEYAEGSAL